MEGIFYPAIAFALGFYIVIRLRTIILNQWAKQKTIR